VSLWVSELYKETNSFHWQIEFKFNEQTSKVLRLDNFNGAEN